MFPYFIIVAYVGNLLISDSAEVSQADMLLLTHSISKLDAENFLLGIILLTLALFGYIMQKRQLRPDIASTNFRLVATFVSRTQSTASLIIFLYDFVICEVAER